MSQSATKIVVRPLHRYFGPSPFSDEPLVVARLEAPGVIVGEALRVEAAVRAVFPICLTEQAEDGSAAPALRLARLVARLARAALNEVRGLVDTAGARGEADEAALLWVGMHDPDVTEAAIRLAAGAVETARTAPEALSAASAELERLLELCRARHPDFQARPLMMAAQKRGIPVLSLGHETRSWQYGWGENGRIFFETASNGDGMTGNRISVSKSFSKNVFRQLGVPTPAARLVNSTEGLGAAAAAVGWPCVAKPLDRGGGRGVSVGLRSRQELDEAFVQARQFTTGPVLVEAHVPGDDYRLTVVDGVLVAAIRCLPAAVVGDGRTSVAGLVAELNRSRTANLVASSYLVPVKTDAAAVAELARQSLDLQSVPEKGRRVLLRGNSNRNTGGTCTDVTAITHPQVRAMAEALATALSLRCAGIDYVTTDVSRPPAETGGAVVEINTVPGIGSLLAAGMSEVEVGSLVLGQEPARVPLVLVVAAEERIKELAEALGFLASSHPGLGWSCGRQAGLGPLRLDVADLPAPQRAVAPLKHRLARAAIIGCSGRELETLGAPVDRAELAVVMGARLSAPWRAVLERISESLLAAEDVNAIIEGCRTRLQILQSSSG